MCELDGMTRPVSVLSRDSPYCCEMIAPTLRLAQEFKNACIVTRQSFLNPASAARAVLFVSSLYCTLPPVEVDEPAHVDQNGAAIVGISGMCYLGFHSRQHQYASIRERPRQV